MDALGINIGFIVMQILLFVILLLVLRGYLYDPILNSLDERKIRIAKGLEDARQAAIARDNAEAEAKKILDDARSEAARIRGQAESTAEARVRQAESEAGDARREILAKADADADERRNQALGDLRGQIASIAIAAANKLVGESLDEKRQHDLIGNFFAKVPAGVSGMRGDSAEITSALPLTESEKSAARRAISAGNHNFKVDPSILGGLVVRVGDQVVDNSVAGQMNSMRDSLN